MKAPVGDAPVPVPHRGISSTTSRCSSLVSPAMSAASNARRSVDHSPLLVGRFGHSVEIGARRGQRRLRPLQRAVHRGHRRVQQLGHLGGGDVENVTQHEYRPLTCRQQLQRRDDGETELGPLDRRLRRIERNPAEQDIREGLQPRDLEPGHERRVGIVECRAYVRRQWSALAP